MHPCLTTAWMKLCELTLKKIEQSKPTDNTIELKEYLVAYFLMTKEIIKSAIANRKEMGRKRNIFETQWVNKLLLFSYNIKVIMNF